MFEHKPKDLTGRVVTLKTDTMVEIAGKMGVGAGNDIVLEHPMQVQMRPVQQNEGLREGEKKIEIGMHPLMLCNPCVDSVRIPRDKVIAIAEAPDEIAETVGKFSDDVKASATWVGTGSSAPSGEADDSGE